MTQCAEKLYLEPRDDKDCLTGCHQRSVTMQASTQ